MDASFKDSRECKLLVDLAAAMDAGDEGVFTDVVKEYDSMSRLDQWKVRAVARSGASNSRTCNRGASANAARVRLADDAAAAREEAVRGAGGGPHLEWVRNTGAGGRGERSGAQRECVADVTGIL